jgi:serine/threonine protein kinase
MGEVYRARDTRLDRVVAIKVLPDHLADRGELRERFEREARSVASLNHPHICTLHDIGRQDGTDYLVMEYLEGETLAQRLLKGPLPLDQVLRYAIEIADALDKAHRKGITHRDLKPGNIMLTKSGTKLLDFGLAKLKQEVAPATPASQLPAPRGASWGSQGMIAFSTNQGIAGLMQVSDAGGSPQVLTRLEKGETGHRLPEFLPGGKAVLFFGGAGGGGHVAVQSVGTGERKNLTETGPVAQTRYAPSGHLVYAQEGILMAAPFDPQRLTATGATVPVVEGVCNP